MMHFIISWAHGPFVNLFPVFFRGLSRTDLSGHFPLLLQPKGSWLVMESEDKKKRRPKKEIKKKNAVCWELARWIRCDFRVEILAIQLSSKVRGNMICFQMYSARTWGAGVAPSNTKSYSSVTLWRRSYLCKTSTRCALSFAAFFFFFKCGLQIWWMQRMESRSRRLNNNLTWVILGSYIKPPRQPVSLGRGKKIDPINKAFLVSSRPSTTDSLCHISLSVISQEPRLWVMQPPADHAAVTWLGRISFLYFYIYRCAHTVLALLLNNWILCPTVRETPSSALPR